MDLRAARILLDECVQQPAAVALRDQGVDIHHLSEVLPKAVPDEAVLVHATNTERFVMTYNVGDFIGLDLAWKAGGREHAGIVVSPEIKDLRVLLHRLRETIRELPDDFCDRVEWIR